MPSCAVTAVVASIGSAQGFTVDSQKLAEWDEWTRKDSLANRLLFRLRNYDLGRPEAATLPLAVKDKLKPLIARPFQTEAEFLAELTPLLTEDEMKSHRATVLKISERTVDIFDRVGGGLEALGPLLIASQGTASVLTQPEFRDGVIDLMSQIQLADGSWTPGGQFTGMRAGRFRRRIKRPRCGRRSHLPLTTHRIRRDLRRFRKPLLINGNRRRIPIIANGWR